MPTILYPPTLDWGLLPDEEDTALSGRIAMFQRPQQLMRSFAKQGWRTIFLDPSPSQTGRQVWEVEPNLFVCKSKADWRELVQGPLVVWASHVIQHTLVDSYEPQLVAWDCLDPALEEFACWAPSVPLMRKRADVVFCTAQSLYEENTRLHKDVHMLPNAADVEHFGRQTEPAADLPKERNILGYIGAVAPWIDWTLIKGICARLGPSWDVVMIGQAFGCQPPKKIENLHWLGYRPYADLPAYLSGFDVAMIPFRQSEMTHAVNPIKLYEYLASGTPVISTPLHDVLRMDAPISVAATAEEFVRAAKKLDTAESRAERLDYVSKHSWDHRAAEAIAVLETRL